MKMYQTLLILLLSSGIFAQTATSPAAVEIDQRLYDVYDTDYLEKLKTVNPFVLQRWNYYLDHSFFIADLDPDKQITPTGTIEISDIDNINVLLLEKEQKLEKQRSLPTYYKIAGTNKYLVFHPVDKFVKKLNEHLGRSYK